MKKKNNYKPSKVLFETLVISNDRNKTLSIE